MTISGHKIAIAICADTNAPNHIQTCATQESHIYIAGIVLTEKGYKTDSEIFKAYAIKYKMLVAIANHNSPTGEYAAIGKSAIWDPNGKVLAANEGHNALVTSELNNNSWTSKIINL